MTFDGLDQGCQAVVNVALEFFRIDNEAVQAVRAVLVDRAVPESWEDKNVVPEVEKVV